MKKILNSRDLDFFFNFWRGEMKSMTLEFMLISKGFCWGFATIFFE